MHVCVDTLQPAPHVASRQRGDSVDTLGIAGVCPFGAKLPATRVGTGLGDGATL